MKSAAELATMRRAGHLLQRILHEVVQTVDVGVRTIDLDKLAYSRIKEAGAIPAFLGQYDFPATLCTSINEEIVHGIPGKRKLQDGDIVSIDCGLILDGLYADTAYTATAGKVSEEVQRLLDTTKKALYAGIEAAGFNIRVGEVSRAIQKVVEGAGYHVVEEYTGHGVGRTLHEDPQIHNKFTGRGPRMGNGLTVAIEPMVNIGTGKTEQLDDGWTVVSADRSLSGHFEHTIAVTKEGVEILTRAPGLDFF